MNGGYSMKKSVFQSEKWFLHEYLCFFPKSAHEVFEEESWLNMHWYRWSGHDCNKKDQNKMIKSNQLIFHRNKNEWMNDQK